MNYSKPLAEDINKALTTLYSNHGLDQQSIELLLETPKNDELGDLAFPCFSLAKSLKMAPVKIATDLCTQLETQMAIL
jgi:arginyl-tRNA synthetase